MENNQPATQTKGTNGLAIASLITSLVGLNVIGVILGFIALSQIKKSNEGGRGLAIAGIIIGFVTLAIGLIIVIWVVWFTSAVTTEIIHTAPEMMELENMFENLNTANWNLNIQ